MVGRVVMGGVGWGGGGGGGRGRGVKERANEARLDVARMRITGPLSRIPSRRVSSCATILLDISELEYLSGAIESISSMKMTDGSSSLAFRKRSLSASSAEPTHPPTISGAETAWNVA